MALVKSGHALAELKLYIDGVADTVTSAAFTKPIEFKRLLEKIQALL